MTTEHELNAPPDETITLRQLLRSKGASPLEAARLMGFIVSWQECTEELGRDPLQREFAEWNGQSISTVERHKHQLWDLIGVPLPNLFPNVVPRLDLEDLFVQDVIKGIPMMFAASTDEAA